jgi:four helix bundle protein
MRDFKKLQVWRRAHAMSVAIHEMVRRMSGRDLMSLKSQLVRAADSIPTNIVEGCGAASQRDFARYLDIAIKSANETEYHLIAAADRGAVDAGEAALLGAEVIEIRRMTYGLRKRILSEVAEVR